MDFPRGNLINPAMITGLNASNLYKKFTDSLPSEQHRRGKLLDYMEIPADEHVASPFTGYAIRAILAANWLSPDVEQQDRLQFLTSITASAVKFAGQTVLQFNGTTLAQLITEPKASKSTDFEILVGTLDGEGYLHYGAKRTPLNERPETAVASPHLYDFSMDLRVKDGQSIRNTDGELSVMPLHDGLIGAYSCRTSLEDDVTLYRRVNTENSDALLFGNARASGVMFALVRSALDETPESSAVYESFTAYLQSQPSPLEAQQPQPDLSFLDGIRLAGEPVRQTPANPNGLLDDIDALLEEMSTS